MGSPVGGLPTAAPRVAKRFPKGLSAYDVLYL
jgi:hypothetical protein